MLEQFKELGYLYQLPKGRDNTLYLVKQEKDYTRQIFIEHTKKEAKVYIYNIIKNNKQLDKPTNREVEEIMNYLIDLGITEYQVVEEKE